MKNQVYISRKWRKITIILLLLNFLFVSIIAAFPEGECNGVCEIENAIHECNSHGENIVQKSCCDMMEMNSSDNTSSTIPCGMELSDIACDFIYHSQVNVAYLIPKIIDVKIEFTQFSTINYKDEIFEIELIELTQNFSEIKKPPIYLTNMVFQI